MKSSPLINRDHAIVVGGSFAGLMTAKVLGNAHFQHM